MARNRNQDSNLPVGAPVIQDKQKALMLLNDLIDGADGVKLKGRKSPVFKEWQHSASVAIANIFGENSINHRRFNGIRYSFSAFSGSTPDSKFEERWRDGVEEARAILRSLVRQVQTYWDAPSKAVGGQLHDDHQKQVQGEPTKRVFVVHGHNDGLKQAVARLLERLEFEPIILHEHANQGRTIIEKFEAHSNVAFAIVLLTADDEGRERGTSELQKRARQNVILELGFFLGSLGRGRVCVLYEDGVDIPSDYSGILYIKFDQNGSWMYGVAKEMKAANFDIDMNKI